MIPYWSTANSTAEYKDLHAVCLATANNGKCALISRRSISVIRTDNLNTVEYPINRDTKWDSTYAEYSTLQHNLLAITNAQTIQIFNTDDPSPNSMVDTLRGHTRTITDLNWSFNDSNALATASYDNYMHIWDLRDSRSPVNSMHSIAGATQVKWSKMNEHTLATCHEGDVRIWDKRKNNTPIYYITAHLSKINGLDWNPFVTTQFVTCAQDGNIKFWDINNYKGKAEHGLNTGLPVWKARYTPFGHGLMTALVPQLRRTGENNSLWMWNTLCLEQPLHSFAGHLDVVLDFGWHLKSSTECELITWAKDCTLRMWKVNGQRLFQSQSNARDSNDDCLSDSESAKLSNLDLSRSSNPSPISNRFESTRSENDDSDMGKLDSTGLSNTVLNLNQEFSLFNQNIPNIIIEELNAQRRICVVAVKSSISCRLKIVFPANYPNNVTPQFMFLSDSDSSKCLSESIKKELLKVLQTTANSLVQRNRSCLEKCLRQFIETFEKLTADRQGVMNMQKTQTTLLDLLPSHKYGSYLDASVPFPRTSGARFCSSDLLVCFGRPPHLEQMNAPTEFTPRSLSALSAYLTSHVRAYNSNLKDNEPSITSFYEKPRLDIDSTRKRKLRHRSKAEKNSPKHKTPNLYGPVSVFTVAKLLPISRVLAEQYLITDKDKNIIEICESNAKIASTVNRRDLNQAWMLVKLSADMYLKNLHSDDYFMISWAQHPFGRKMIQSMIEHYALKCNDIQMAAMLACVFDSANIKSDNGVNNNNVLNRLDDSSPVSIYTRVATPDSDHNSDSAIFNDRIRTRSTSSSHTEEEANSDARVITSQCGPDNETFEKESILDDSLKLQYDYFKKIYADILYRWKLLEKRSILLKFVQSNCLIDDGKDCEMNLFIECLNSRCRDKAVMSNSLYCGRCHTVVMTCIICRLPVRGLAVRCVKCGHGGHSLHMQEWFHSQIYCPTGCGCACTDTSYKSQSHE